MTEVPSRSVPPTLVLVPRVPGEPAASLTAANEGESLVAAAMRSVRDHIRANGLRVGDTLPGEHHFAGALGVSRAVMREAFGALAALRLIDVGNGRRARVAAIDGAVMGAGFEHAVTTEQVSITDIWDVRRTIELRTAALAALHRTPSEADRILELAGALTQESDPVRVASLDIAFHQAVARATHNAVFLQVVRSFENMMHAAVPAAWRARTQPEQRSEARDIHLAIATAIDAGDPIAAVAAMERHFDTSIIRAARFEG